MVFNETRTAHDVYLRIRRPQADQIRYSLFENIRRTVSRIAGNASDNAPQRFEVELTDVKGNSQNGEWLLDLNRKIESGDTWGAILTRYAEGDAGENEFTAFGRDLFASLIRETVWVRCGAASGVRQAVPP